MNPGARLAAAATGFVGTRFRLHGRTRESGLDCVGLIEASLRICGTDASLPNGYALRSLLGHDHARTAAMLGLVWAPGPGQPGDVLILQPDMCQTHLAIALDTARIVHAHAGLGKVVVSSLPDSWALLAAWRLPFPA